MLTLEDYKKSLGPITDDLSDEDIIKVRDAQDAIAELLFPMWLDIQKQKRLTDKTLCITLPIEKIASSTLA
jgi:hypothetical protein